MEKGKETAQISKTKERIEENLQKAVSIIILLENDMNLQNSDGVGANAVKVIHDILKAVQLDIGELFNSNL